jgi:hypothetical protein
VASQLIWVSTPTYKMMAEKTDITPVAEPTVIPASRTLVSLLGMLERQFNREIGDALKAEVEDRGFPEGTRYDPERGWVMPV